MLSMLVVLVIVERPQAHTGTLRGLRRRLFSSRLDFSRDAIRGHGPATMARNTRTLERIITARTWTPLDPQKIFACGGRYLLKNTSVSCTLWEPDPNCCFVVIERFLEGHGEPEFVVEGV